MAQKGQHGVYTIKKRRKKRKNGTLPGVKETAHVPSGILRRNTEHLLLVSIKIGKHEMLLPPALSMFGYLAEARVYS